MVSLATVEQQLKDIGVKVHFWDRPEMAELEHILIPGEVIQGCVNGRYEGGFATLCATDQRLLLIDKKMLRLSVEDIRYDMISEVDYATQILSGTVRICTPTKALTFTSFKPKVMRVMASFIQQRVIEIRQQYQGQPQQQQVYAQQLAPVPAPVKAPTTEAPFIDPRQPGVPVAEQSPQALPVDAALPMPLPSRNPYATTPLMMRRRVGRFGVTIAQSHPHPTS